MNLPTKRRAFASLHIARSSPNRPPAQYLSAGPYFAEMDFTMSSAVSPSVEARS